MPRRRMIDPDIWQNENFSELSILARLVFIGMFSNADDEGKGRAKPAYIKSTVFIYDENIRVSDIKKTLQEIGSKMSVTFYTSNGNEYYRLDNWSKWQRVDKPQPSKIPDPPQGLENKEQDKISDSDIILEVHTNNSRIIPESFSPKRKEEKRNLKQEKPPISPQGVGGDVEEPQIKTVRGEEPPVEHSNPFEERFILFWQAYPKKVGKGEAEKRFMKIKPSQALLEIMITAVQAAKQSSQWKKENGQYIPNPATWLGQKRWEDELGEKSNKTMTASKSQEIIPNEKGEIW